MRKSIFIVLPLMLFVWRAESQIQLDLKDLSAFRPQAGNWRVVGSVAIDPSVDIHDKVPAPAAAGKKGRKNAPADMVLAQPVSWTDGSGVLLNLNDDKIKSHLLTVMEHGDIELDLELMVPKGSNSGIYLQGRYEVQILDSWGVKNPSFSDIGGIYRNWENTPGQIYMGKAPLSNPAKAPGLWQHMHIVFRAPRFDSSGKKTENARFITVELNGVQIHSNLEVPLATGGPIDKNEAATGPLMIQGDHGPVAFRNIRYRLLREVKPELREVTWAVHHGSFKVVSEFENRKPAYTGSGKELTVEILDVEDQYAVTFKAKLFAPETGKYSFSTVFTGGARMFIDGRLVIDHQSTDHWPLERATADLGAGEHTLTIHYYKDAGWMPPRLSLNAGIADGKEMPLHAYNSYPPDPNPVASIYLDPGASPRLLRAFLDFNGDRNKRLTHTIGVGDPSGIHYVYDLKSGNLVCGWRGRFVDATPMWHDRGDGSFRPMGAANYTFTGQPVSVLNASDALFPAEAYQDFVGKGYEIDPSSGRPAFRSLYRGVEVTSKVTPDEYGRFLRHEVTFKDRASLTGLHYKLAEGKSITMVADGSYAIDDARYFIKVVSGGKPVVRDVEGRKELVLPVEGNSLSYHLIW